MVPEKLNWILATDCGSTTTKAILIAKRGETYRHVVRGEAPTTVEAPFEDVTRGVLNAIMEVEELAGVEGWMTHGEVPTAHVARVWVSPERARWLREERTVVEELADGAVVVELPYAGTSWLVREILRGAGDLVVLEPEDAREAIAKEVGG